MFLKDEKYSKIAKYINRSTNVFQCPSDTYLSADEEGPWMSIYKHVRKISEFVNPAPSEAYMFLEEHPDSMNDSAFFSPSQSQWIVQPASYHDGADTFAFADGHAEMHMWEGSLITPQAQSISLTGSPHAPATINDPDIHWVSYHTSRVSTNSY